VEQHGGDEAVSDAEHVRRQKAFYESREHAHLRAREDDLYADRLAGALASALGIGAGHRVLEVGAGFGRFTFPLLRRCREMVALDLSRRVLDELEQERDARGIPASRCRTLCRDVAQVRTAPELGAFDFVVGFFFLHHLEDVAATVAALSPLLAPGGGLGFVEPNRRNPLFALQLACCRDMTWREEAGLFRLSARGVEDACRSAGLRPLPVRSCGFFPPQIVNRSAAARRLETRLEGMGALRPWLPFLLLCARNPG
jgi:SAM-dependent methyltransferase